MNDPITTYVDEVAHHLRARGRARRIALADLEAALREAADEATDAVAGFGPAEAYAAALDAELGTQRRLQTLLGIPNSLAPGAMERMAATFDPSDPRLVVPHVFGIGWAINAGALAVRLGLLNPDDLDDEVLTEASEGPGTVARVLAWTGIGIAVATTIATYDGHRAADPTTRRAAGDLPGVAVAVALASTLAAAASTPGLPPRQRLVAPAYATLLASVVAGDRGAVRQDGSTPLAGGGYGLLVGAALWFASTYGPVRAVVRRRVRNAAADLGSSRGPSKVRDSG